MEPIVELMDVPPGYAAPTRTMSWESVRGRLEAARVYWFATTRPDGRPHVVPRDGMWVDGTLVYGGSAETVHHHNVKANPAVTMHIGTGTDAIIVDGIVREEQLDQAAASNLADLSFTKYPEYGRQDPSLYAAGVLVLRPVRVLAWTSFGLDNTRFRFPISNRE